MIEETSSPPGHDDADSKGIVMQCADSERTAMQCADSASSAAALSDSDHTPSGSSGAASGSKDPAHAEPGPLAGIRVLDVGTRISAPFCAGLLGELGAEVIKVELPGQGDFMRGIGPFLRTNAREHTASSRIDHDAGPAGSSAGNSDTQSDVDDDAVPGGSSAGNSDSQNDVDDDAVPGGSSVGNPNSTSDVDDDCADPGYSLFWAVEGRGRSSITCDLRSSEGQALFRRLATQADVLCENFRPGTMESWGLGPDDLDPELVYVRISVFGQDGPYARRPGLDRLGIAYGGLLHLTGEPDRPPVRPGVTIADYLTGTFAAVAAVAGLYERDIVCPPQGSVVASAHTSPHTSTQRSFSASPHDAHRGGPATDDWAGRYPAENVSSAGARTGGRAHQNPGSGVATGSGAHQDLGSGVATEGRSGEPLAADTRTHPSPGSVRRRAPVVDAALYGAILRVLEWTLAGYDRLDMVRNREGNRLSSSAPLDNYPTADGAFVCIVAGSDTNFGRLCRAMDRPELVRDDRFSTLARRAQHSAEINDLVAAWTITRTSDQIEQACITHDVPVGRAYTAADIFADPHMAARGDLVTIDDPVVGPIRQQAPFPRFVGRRAPTPRGAPRLGEDNDHIWHTLVGLTPDELDGLRERRVI